MGGVASEALHLLVHLLPGRGTLVPERAIAAERGFVAQRRDRDLRIGRIRAGLCGRDDRKRDRQRERESLHVSSSERQGFVPQGTSGLRGGGDRGWRGLFRDEARPARDEV